MDNRPGRPSSRFVHFAWKVCSWALAAVCAIIVLGAAWLWTTGEMDAAVACARETYHSAECKDIRTLQYFMMLFGGGALIILAVQVLVWRAGRRR